MIGGVDADESDTARLELDLLVARGLGEKDRTLVDFGPLARSVGLEVSASGRQPSGRFVVECRRVATKR